MNIKEFTEFAFNAGKHFERTPHQNENFKNWYKSDYTQEQIKLLNLDFVVGSEAELKCPECLNKVDQHELDMFGGLCEECSAF